MLELPLLANLALVALNHHQIMHYNFCLQIGCGWFWRIHEAPSLLFLATAFLLGLQYCKHTFAAFGQLVHHWLTTMRVAYESCIQ